MRRAVALFWISALMVAVAGAVETVHLDRGEERLPYLNHLALKDFHFAWDIRYLEIFSFEATSRNGARFRLDPKTKTHTLLRIGTYPQTAATRKARRWLMRAILKRNYFWKSRYQPPGDIYGFTTLQFATGDGRLKAIETQDEIRQMLGTIDNHAKLQLWLYALNRTGAYSAKRTRDGYRIRYSYVDPFSCYYEEYFLYLNAKTGTISEPKWIKKYAVKGCNIIQM